jgi:hypothetical protein
VGYTRRSVYTVKMELVQLWVIHLVYRGRSVYTVGKDEWGYPFLQRRPILCSTHDAYMKSQLLSNANGARVGHFLP